MFNHGKFSLVFLSTVLFAVGCDTSGDDRATRVRNTVDTTDLGLLAAVDAAELANPGAVVVEAELELENNTPVFEVQLLADTTLTKLHIDPTTGKVLRSEPERDADDLAEATAAAALLRKSGLDAAAAITLAESQRPGNVAFEFEVKRNLLEVEVLDGDALFEVRIDPGTGKVTAVDPSDDDDQLEPDDDGDDNDDDNDDDTNDDDDDDTNDDDDDDDTK